MLMLQLGVSADADVRLMSVFTPCGRRGLLLLWRPCPRLRRVIEHLGENISSALVVLLMLNLFTSFECWSVRVQPRGVHCSDESGLVRLFNQVIIYLFNRRHIFLKT